MYLVGIDVGTTNTKAVILDVESGQVRAVGSARTITRHPRVEWSEFDAGELWGTVIQSLRAATSQCDHPEQIRAISVASMGEAGFPLDAEGTVLYPAIAWYDPRTTAEAQWWEETFGRERMYEISGHTIHSMFGINKLLWLRTHKPDAFERVRHWLSIEDFVLWKLSGNFATDYSIASRTMVFDQQALNWSDTLLEHAGIPADWLPAAFPGGTAIGTLRQEVAAETGLPQSTTIVTGGHDHLCGALAVGVTRPGQFLDSTGTTSVILVLNDAFRHSEELLASGYNSYAYVERGKYITHGSLSFAGGAFEWLATLLYGQGSALSNEAYEQALRESAQVPPGSRGAVVLPYFLGPGAPYKRDSALGAILNLTPSHGRAELIRALLEGLAFWIRDNLQALHDLGVAPAAPEIIAVGGSARSAELMQIKANLTGCRIRVPDVAEAAATGAALLAGVGVGIFSSGEAAAASVRRTEKVYEPESGARAEYEDIYRNTYLPARNMVLG